MIIALVGNNSFGLQQRLHELTDEFLGEYGEFALERIDAEEAELNEILEAVASMPFLAARKMVVVRSLGVNKQASEQVEQIISSVSDTTDLIIYDPLTDKRTKYYKTIKKDTQLEEFNELDTSSLASWIVDEASKRGGQLKSADARYLVERVGANQMLLSSELDKLVSYQPEISRANIDLLCAPTPQSKIFDLLDAAFGSKKDRALKLYEEQRAQKVEPQAILAMIAWQLQMLAVVKYSGGRSSGEVAKDLGVNPYPVSKISNLAKNLSEEKLAEMVNEAFNIDIKSKTTQLDLDEALKTYIVATL